MGRMDKTHSRDSTDPKQNQNNIKLKAKTWTGI